MAATSRLQCLAPCVAATLLLIALSLRAPLDAQPLAANGIAPLSGTVVDGSGRKLGGVDVRVDGSQALTTATHSDGTFSFPNMAPGLYRLSLRKPSYNPLTRSDIVIAAGAPVVLDLALEPVSFTSLRVIAVTNSSGSGTAQINTSPAAISTVSKATLLDQDVHQVSQILNEIPGIVTTVPANSTNIAAGTMSTAQVPQIRGALQYETESLIDGHPVSVGISGYFAPLFLNPHQLQSVEVVKGPGATPPDINYAVGGSVNYITLMPTAKAHYSFDIDHDSYGGTSTNVSATGTVDRGRLGYALAYGIDGTPGPLNNYRVPGSVTEVAGGSSATINGVPYCGKASLGTGCFQTAGAGPTNIAGLPTFGVGLYACCDALSSQYLARTELAKLRYAFSDQTSLTVAYLGAQSSAAYAQTFAYSGITFTPPAGYKGSVAAHTSIPLAFDTYSPYTLATTQGLLESEFRTSVGNDSLLFRYYAGANNSNDYNVAFGDGVYNVSTRVWGGLPNATGGTTYYNDTPATVSVSGAGTSVLAQDHFDGLSGEFNIPAGNNLYTLSLDRTRHNSYAANLYDLSSQNTTQIPSGSSQAFTTASVRALLAVSPKINLNIANYFIGYKTHYTADGGATWSNSSSTFYAPRLALTYRVNPRSIARLSLGSSIAPPYLALVTTQGGAPQPNVEGDPSFYTETKNTGKFSPESAFGYDLGFDQRIARDTALSGDIYLTNLDGQFLTSTTAQGTYTGTSGVNAGFTAPLFVQEAQNLGSSRYDGLELSVHRTPALGFGYRVQGSLMRAYAYDLPHGFYDTADGKNTTNLGVIPNINFQPTGLVFNGISNGRIPYATGYAEVNVRKKRAYYSLGATYYGSNNAYNEPAFAVVNATARYDIAQHTSFQVSANNVTSAYSTAWGSLQGGIPAPLENGLLGALPGVTVGPSNFHFVLRHDFGN